MRKTIAMKLYDFTNTFPDEDSCRSYFKEVREKNGMICPRCGKVHYHWLENKRVYHCNECGYRWSLRVGTVMEGSKLPFRYWFVAMHLLTSTKHSFSASEIQRQLGHKRYQPIWGLVHKIRSVMGQRDGKYTLCSNVEVDEGKRKDNVYRPVPRNET